MMRGWQEIKLSTVCKSIEYGYTASSVDKNTGTKLLRITDIASDRINWDSVPFCEITDKDFDKYCLTSDDIVIARTGATVGYAKQIRSDYQKSVFASYLIRIKLKNDISTRFIGKLIESSIYKTYIQTIAGGSAQPNANAKDLTTFPFYLPPLPTQRKIAAILSAYDDLIENNNRRIAILEKMAEELYKEWFVRLRFPGHDKVKVVKGVPEGWEVKSVEDSFEILGGGTPSTLESYYWSDGEINWYSPTDITSNNALFSFRSKNRITETGLKESSAKIFPAYSVMLTSRATIGEISINTTPACTNQGFITCIPNDKIPLYYLVYWLKLNKETFIQLANGSTFLEITKGKFKNIQLLVPHKHTMDKYNQIQKPIFKSIENMLQDQAILVISRDRLLTRLMSGKIDVEKMDIKFPQSMAETVNA